MTKISKMAVSEYLISQGHLLPVEWGNWAEATSALERKFGMGATEALDAVIENASHMKFTEPDWYLGLYPSEMKRIGNIIPRSAYTLFEGTALAL